MKKGLKKSLSVLVAIMLFMSTIPISAIAEDVNVSTDAVVTQETKTVESSIIQTTDHLDDVKPQVELATGEKGVMPEVKANSIEANGFQYEKEKDGIKIIAYVGKVDETKTVAIPDKINEVDVTAIGADVFKGNCDIEEVKISRNIKTLDAMAFEGCSSLKRITVDENNEAYSSKDGILYNKGSGELLVKPANWQESDTDKTEAVDQITIVAEDKDQIAEDSSDQSVTDTNNIDVNAYIDVGDIRYEDIDGGVEVSGYLGSGGDITIPATIYDKYNKVYKNVIQIGRGAFFNDKITSISIPNSVKTIESEAFYGCTELSKITIPDSVTTLGHSAFRGCTRLESAALSKAIKTIEINSFWGCTALTGISIPGSVTTIGNSAFYGCTALSSVLIPNSITTIGDSFYNYPYTTSDRGAFSGCTALKSVVIPDGVTEIGCYTFYQCSNLRSVVLGSGIKEMGEYAFSECTLLEKIIIPDSLKGIDEYVFYGCSNLKSVDCGKGLETIERQAFYKCPNIESITILDNVTFIHGYNFEDLTSATIYGVTGSYAQEYADWHKIPFVGLYGLAVKSFATDKPSGQSVNTNIKLTAVANGGTAPYQYSFSYRQWYPDGSNVAGGIQGWSTSNTANFIPDHSGNYELILDVKDAKGLTVTKSIYNYQVVDATPLSVSSFTTDKPSGQPINTSIKLTATGTGGTPPYQYHFYYTYGTVGVGTTSITVQDYSTSNTAIFKPTKAGTYTLYVQIKDAAGRTATKTIFNYKIVDATPLSVSSFTTDKPSGQAINTSIILTATGAGGKSPYQYKIYYTLGTATVVLKDYSTVNTATFKPTKAGTYTLYAQVKDASGNTSTKSMTYAVTTTANIDCFYRTHIQNIGWQATKMNGEISGTSGQGLRLEAIQMLALDSSKNDVGIKYQTHIQNIGWQNWQYDGTVSGTSGQGLRLEAIRIQLTGVEAASYDVYYQVHAENFGWLDWAKNGASAGTEGYGYRLEAIKIRIVPKGSAAPGETMRPFVKKGPVCTYRTHVENIGWQSWMSQGSMSGTSGKALRLEGIEIKTVNAGYNIGVQYQTHVENIGWQAWKANGTMSGTSGQSLRLEAIRLKLTGTDADKFDVYYQVHAQNFGWLGWAKNGASAGTEGYGYRLEGIRIVVVPKGDPAPGTTVKPFVKK